jgi:hypothetical protein
MTSRRVADCVVTTKRQCPMTKKDGECRAKGAKKAKGSEGKHSKFNAQWRSLMMKEHLSTKIEAVSGGKAREGSGAMLRAPYFRRLKDAGREKGTNDQPPNDQRNSKSQPSKKARLPASARVCPPLPASLEIFYSNRNDQGQRKSQVPSAKLPPPRAALWRTSQRNLKSQTE